MRTKLVVILTLSYLFLSVLATQRVTFAEETTTRLYIPTSNQTMIVKDAAKTSLVVKDYLGSSRAVDQNNTMQVEEYYPYGADVKDMDIDVDRKFTGHREFDDAGVYHAGARFYNQELGIFVQADKVEGGNKYKYANNSPMIYKDPTGNSPIYEPSSKRMTYPSPLEIDPHNDEKLSVYKTYRDKNGDQISKYSQLFSDPELHSLAWDYIQRNPYNPVSQEREFIQSLMQDIYSSSPYNKKFLSLWDSQEQLEVQLNQNLLQMTGEENFISSQTLKSGDLSRFRTSLTSTSKSVDKELSAYEQIYYSKSLAQRIKNDEAVCADFCLFTGYALSQVGIQNAVGGTSQLHHAFGIVPIDGIPEMYDTTWSAYMTSFYEDRTGQNEYSRSYDEWRFDTPWGNPFNFDLVTEPGHPKY